MKKTLFGYVMNVTILLTVLFLGNAIAITYLNILVDGVESDTLVQGQSYGFEMDCNPSGTVRMLVIPDINDNGEIDPGEESIIPVDARIIDNGDPDAEGPPFFDNDPTEGYIYIEMFIYVSVGNWIVCFIEEGDSASAPLHILPPDPFEMSVSGRVTLEGITPPDNMFSRYHIIAGTMDPPMLIFVVIDSMGDYSFNWPGEEGTIMVIVEGEDGDPYDTTVFVDSHVEGFDIFVPVRGISYLRVLAEGIESETLIQGIPYVFEMVCNPMDTIWFSIIPDLNHNGIRDPGEESIIPADACVIDNVASSDEVPFFDSDMTGGFIHIDMIIHIMPGEWILRFSDRISSVSAYLNILPPDPLERSVSGRMILEGVTPPDSVFRNLQILAGIMEPPMLMLAIPDSMGDYSLNWPGDEGMIMVMVTFPEGDPYDTMVYVDGHVTGFDIYTAYGGLNNFHVYVEGEISSIQHQGEYYFFAVNCAPYSPIVFEIFVDNDSNGTIDVHDYSLFDTSWVIQDNGYYTFIGDVEESEGLINVEPPFNLPVGHYVIRASDPAYSLCAPLAVLPPDPLNMSISGRVTLEGLTPPDTILPKILVAALYTDSTAIYLAFCDGMGDYTCYWAESPGTLTMKLWKPYPHPDYSFSSVSLPVTVDEFETGVDIIVPITHFDDSILINYSSDPDEDPVSSSSVTAVYFDPITGIGLGELRFAPEPPIYIPVRPGSCAVEFRIDDPLHYYVSPPDTLWMTETSYPEDYDIHVNSSSSHFYLYLDGMNPDSLPVGGLAIPLYGTDAEEHTYYCTIEMFGVLEDEEYKIRGHRELCDADWRMLIPEALPGHYSSTVTETTITIPEMPGHPRFDMHIPVNLEGITETIIPSNFDLKLYPNPFNSNVTITFQLPEPSRASITIYNLKGEAVTELVNDNFKTGTYTVSWNTSTPECAKLPTGIYFVSLKTECNMRIKKGLLIK
ncbi:T9SS type A sorting domain-containing protein [bacterium]|nr:T9SS type A sorting domain-containing protein [bacterium]